MTKQYTHLRNFRLVALAAVLGSSAWGQNQLPPKGFEAIRSELVAWDPVRGEWLSSSMAAMSANQRIPDRNFPEDLTPAEMYRALPAATQENVRIKAQTQLAANSRDSLDAPRWEKINTFTQRPGCKPEMGRTYGDPHLSSFDGASYSFQTVGEFVLVKSGSNHMEVQVRQKAQSDNFSLNTATAMNVAGDRLCIYAQDMPDANNATPIRVNGQAVFMQRESYYLPHGGTIRHSGGNNYLVTWPTGETVTVDIRRSGSFPFMNVAAQVYPCVDTYEGILGNANGRPNDDFDTRGGGSRPASLTFHNFGNANDQASRAMEQEYLAFMARDFARSWRVTPNTTLFDYGFNESTFTFTDESFPRVHHTLADLSPDQRDRARKDCERQGITGNDLNACIYDGGFLHIEPAPKPVVPVVTPGREFKPVSKPVPNVNPDGDVGPDTPPTPPVKPVAPKGVANEGTSDPAQPKPASDPNKKVPDVNPTSSPSGGTSPTPTQKEEKQPEWKPVSTPAPRPTREERKPDSKPVHSTPTPVSRPVETPAPVTRPTVVVPRREEPKPAPTPVSRPSTPAPVPVSRPSTPAPATPKPSTPAPVKSTPTIVRPGKG